MRRLILKILLFLSIIIVADKLFGMVMDSVLDATEKGDWGRNNYIFNDLKSDVVILGSSRAIHHYNPQIFTDTLGMSCYNCGEDGMGIFLMYARYKAISQRYCPQLIIYEVLPGFDILSEKDNLKYLKYLRPYHGIASVDSVINAISPLESLKLLSDGYRYNSCFVDIIAQRLSKDSETAKDYSYSPLFKQMDYELNVENAEVETDLIKISYLEDLIKCCKTHGTMLIFTASPVYKPISDNGFMSLKQLCKTYNVPFINHYGDTLYSNESSYFADATHLNKKGADSFASQLASQIKEYIQK